MGDAVIGRGDDREERAEEDDEEFRRFAKPEPDDRERDPCQGRDRAQEFDQGPRDQAEPPIPACQNADDHAGEDADREAGEHPEQAPGHVIADRVRREAAGRVGYGGDRAGEDARIDRPEPGGKLPGGDDDRRSDQRQRDVGETGPGHCLAPSRAGLHGRRMRSRAARPTEMRKPRTPITSMPMMVISLR